MKTVAVTGITGKTGKWFIDRLNAEPHIFDQYKFRAATRQKSFHAKNIKIINGDIKKPDFCKELCKNADVLLHIAGIKYSFPCLDAAAECGVKRIIIVLTTDVFTKYQTIASPYLLTEQRIEELAEKHDIALTSLRPTMIYGDLQDQTVAKYVDKIYNQKPIAIIDDGKYERQPVYAKDIGEAYFDVLVNPEATAGKSYVLAGAEPTTQVDMYRTIAEQLDKENAFFTVPYTAAFIGAWFLRTFIYTKVDFRDHLKRMAESTVFSNEDAARDLGYSPMNFSDGIRFATTQYLEQKSGKKSSKR